mmetsp:Transcript_70954/g.164029  ORF Transcript_70954/g.164029 Transcript_70954/m.164029 type:complete len:385 (+) Transcript_70954:51-1205(+)
MALASRGIPLVLLLQRLDGGVSELSTPYPIDCKAGLRNWKVGWSEQKKAYCCQHEQVACPERTGTVPFIICQVGLENWEVKWSSWKKSWCCQRSGVNCPTTSTVPQYECRAGLPSGQAWAPAKRAWCCKHKGIACTTTTVATTAPTTLVATTTVATTARVFTTVLTTLPPTVTFPSTVRMTPAPVVTTHAALTIPVYFDCQVGLSNWQTGWTHAKKAWCCQHENYGCEQPAAAALGTPAVAPSLEACNALCEYQGVSATCRDRIAWSVKHRFRITANACEKAHRLVLGECSVCARCDVEAVGCGQQASKLTFFKKFRVGPQQPVKAAHTSQARLSSGLQVSSWLLKVPSFTAGALTTFLLLRRVRSCWPHRPAADGQEVLALIE